jgi:hypothetical protein
MSAKKLAGSRRVKVVDPFPDAAAVVGVVPAGDGYTIEIDNREDFAPDELASMLRDVADQLDGRNDRTRGLF